VLVDGVANELRVFDGCGRVVDRARADDDEQAIICAMKNVSGGGAGMRDEMCFVIFEWESLFEQNRRDERVDVADAQVVGDVHGVMVNGQWSMVNGQWRMENGEWRMENGEWRGGRLGRSHAMENGGGFGK